MSEETKKAVKAPKLEAIEMTPEQKEEFLQFMEKKNLEAQKKADEEQFKGMTTKVNLKFQHNINGKKFGPGRMVEIPMSLLGQLEHQENKKRMAELRLLTSNKRTFEMLTSGQSIEVGGTRSPGGL